MSASCACFQILSEPTANEKAKSLTACVFSILYILSVSPEFIFSRVSSMSDYRDVTQGCVDMGDMISGSVFAEWGSVLALLALLEHTYSVTQN